MKYNTAQPYFPQEDIDKILLQMRDILEGNGLFSKGPTVKSFEKLFSEYTGSKYCVAVNSGTSALEIVSKAIGIKNGDEVIVPTQTFVSTGSCVINNGGTLVISGIDKNHLLDFEDLKTKITNKTKAVIIVHFCGLIHPDILRIKNYLNERSIFLIEDAAHAHGAQINDIFAGNIGDFGCFSFYSTKIMTTGGEGGIITTNNQKYFELCESLGAIGIDKKSKVEIYTNAGSNNRMSEFQAIMGISQLQRLEGFVEHRNTIAGIYKNKLSQLREKGVISFQKYPENIRHPYWRFMVVLNDKNTEREKIKEKLNKYGINIDWLYQPLLHLQPVFKNRYGLEHGYLKKSEERSRKHLCLPVHMSIMPEDAEFIVDKFVACF